MPEITEAGMYKEWWANPAVVGLMGFATTTMATGLHNVGFCNGPSAVNPFFAPYPPPGSCFCSGSALGCRLMVLEKERAGPI